MDRQYYRLAYALPIISAVTLFMIFSMTDPVSAGPSGMLLVFFMVYVMFASIFFIVLHTGISFATRMLNKHKSINIKVWRVGVRKSYYVASVLAFGPVLLLALQSVGQLQIRDALLTTVFIAISIFYVLKRS